MQSNARAWPRLFLPAGNIPGQFLFVFKCSSLKWHGHARDRTWEESTDPPHEEEAERGHVALDIPGVALKPLGQMDLKAAQMIRTMLVQRRAEVLREPLDETHGTPCHACGISCDPQALQASPCKDESQ